VEDLLLVIPVLVGATVEAKHIFVTPVVRELRVGRLTVLAVADLDIDVKREAGAGDAIWRTAAPITSG